MNKTSYAWNYFEDLGDYAKCKNCNHRNDLRKNKNTSGMIGHLKREHSNLYVELQKKNEERKLIKSANQPTIDSLLSSPDSQKQDITPLMVDISHLVAKDGLNFNQISNSEVLQKWCSKIYKHSKIKSRESIKKQLFSYSSFIKQKIKFYIKHKINLGFKITIILDEWKSLSNLRFIGTNLNR